MIAQSCSQINKSESQQPTHSRQSFQPKALTSPLPNTILVPVYVRIYLTELVSVSVEAENIKARFTLYLTLPKNLPDDVFNKLEKQEKGSKKQLVHFLNNNLSIQFGNQHIDIINPSIQSTLRDSENKCRSEFFCDLASSTNDKNRPGSNVQHQQGTQIQQRREDSKAKVKNKKSQSKINTQNEDDEEDQAYCESFFVTDQSWLHSDQYITWVVEGVFDCDYSLDNKFFPCMTINSGLTITIHEQNYKKVKISYELMILQTDNRLGVKNFDFLFYKEEHKKFGIYNLNLHSADSTFDFEDSKILQKTNNDQISLITHSGQRRKKYKTAEIHFDVLSYNLPFIMRYEIPMWTLCFASIMLYFVNPLSISGIFSNIILITVSEISLFSSFRMSNFRTDYPCMYEISLISCITTSFLLLISSTITFQNQDLSTQINGKLPNYDPLTRCFIAAITICGSVSLFNIIVLVWKGIMIKRLRFNPQLERNSRICLTWNEDIFKLMFTRYRMT